MKLLTLQPEALARAAFAFRDFRDELDRQQARGRISVYELPKPNRVYTLGFDTARGLAGRDQSTVSVWDKTAQQEGSGRSRQVCEAAGYWGGENFDRLVYALHAWYNGAFILGEAQDQGLAVLRRLVDDYGVRDLYYDKAQGSLAELVAKNPRLGWNRQANDVTLTHFQGQLRDRLIEIRSPALEEQMRRLKWKPRSKQAEKDERQGDEKLVARLDGGGSPDLIMAAMYGVYALTQVHLFVEPPRFKYAPGTLGYDLGHNEFEAEQEEAGGADGSWR